MRRVALLALLALALPTAALATSIGTNDYTNYGTVSAGTATVSGSATTSLTISSQLISINSTLGNLGKVTVTTGTISGGVFTGGTISIVNTNNVTLFSSTLTGGTVTVIGGNTFVAYNLGGIVGGFQLTNGNIVSGDTIVTPEPGTLGLLGTGLVGLAGVIRRKVRG
jgi:PEP-CTERM motif